MTRKVQFCFLIGIAGFGDAQQVTSPETPRPAFEVASIKPSTAPQSPMLAGLNIQREMRITGTRVRYPNISLRDCIRNAYGLKDFQIVGPEWMATVRFDIEARMPEGASADLAPRMLQTLLEDRFQLVAHHDMQERDVYALVAGKNGPKLKVADSGKDASPDEPTLSPEERRARAEASSKKNLADTLAEARADGGSNSTKINMHGITMTQLADRITRFVDRPVLNRTEIEGKYDFSLDVPPGSGMASQIMTKVRAMNGMPEAASGDNLGPSIFESVDKYGLRLEKTKAAVNCLIVDSAFKNPAEN